METHYGWRSGGAGIGLNSASWMNILIRMQKFGRLPKLELGSAPNIKTSHACPLAGERHQRAPPECAPILLRLLTWS
ncbi:hypothetical protein IF2G_00031 [Cordyceps javanica]|nr:hypothetical protein IF2G_00031 [Cordyceps javanica]